jgi:outer membrane protein assembly factor BamB
MKTKVSAIGGAVALILALSACSDEEILEGQRFDLRTPIAALNDPEAAPKAEEPVKVPAFKAPAARAQTAWTHRNGNAQHQLNHVAFSAAPQLAWVAQVGQGNNRRGRITAQPVAENGRVFALDGATTVTALDASGAPLWSRDLTPLSDNAGEASGGAMTLGEGRVFVTTGFGELHALNQKTGATVWKQKLESAAAGAPTYANGLVYVSARDGQGWAISAKDGRVRWTLPAVPSTTVLIGGPAPAVTKRSVVFPFASGELVATLPQGGIRLWASTVSGERIGRAYARIADISADPVIDGGTIYSGNPSGRFAAIDLASGERKWTLAEGATGPAWVAGGSVFFLTDEARLIRASAKDGALYWATPLELYDTDNPRRRKAVYAHYGPVLAGGQLWVASSNGQLRAFDPSSGAVTGMLDLPGGAASAPIVVNGTLYVVNTKGQMLAFR